MTNTKRARPHLKDKTRPRKKPVRTGVFTPEKWHRMLARLNGTSNEPVAESHRAHLAAGIDYQRKLLEERNELPMNRQPEPREAFTPVEKPAKVNGSKGAHD